MSDQLSPKQTRQEQIAQIQPLIAKASNESKLAITIKTDIIEI